MFCGVRACAGVYVDNVPCAAALPFPVFIELCLSLQPWQQKMTNGRTVETLRLCVRLNGGASFLDRKSNYSVWPSLVYNAIVKNTEYSSAR